MKSYIGDQTFEYHIRFAAPACYEFTFDQSWKRTCMVLTLKYKPTSLYEGDFKNLHVCNFLSFLNLVHLKFEILLLDMLNYNFSN